jgi:hypothetical protein
MKKGLHIEDLKVRRGPRVEDYGRRISDLGFFAYVVLEWSKIHTLERWKLRTPRCDSQVTSWPELGDAQLTGASTKVRPFAAKVRGFCFDKQFPM